MVDLHRHDEYSFFDGFGKAKELAEIAKKKGHTSLSVANHGNTNGLIQHYNSCRELEIKPIMGIECYFKPKLNKERKSYHLCLFIKDYEGYKNLNRLLFEAEKQKYYVPIVTPDLIKKYRKGLICTSACIASYFSFLIQEGKNEKAEKVLSRFNDLFDGDFYIEIQPYKLSEVGLQEKVNIKLIKLAKKLGIKCILTSDSHYGKRKDFDTYKKMHEIAKHGYDIEATYGERFMPTEKELIERFVEMHKNNFKNPRKMAENMILNLEEIEDKVEDDILENLKLTLPKFSEENSFNILLKKVKENLKKMGKYNDKYIKRCKEELKVIKYHKFEDYFLIVADYVNWAKDKKIAVGPGRGSVCNCLVAYLLGITEVDSLLFKLDFRRFLRLDKSKMPDIDLDFETSRRIEVLQYLTQKYKNESARICSYGLYRVDNLINDLAKVSGLDMTNKDITVEEKAEMKRIITSMKKLVNKYIVDDTFEKDKFLRDKKAIEFNNEYDNIFKHFVKLYKKVRFIGTHAAGVAITGTNLLDYTTFKKDKLGDLFTNYDLADLESINVTKFDVLGLKTMESLSELRKMTGNKGFKEEWLNDKKILNEFNKGNTNGIFQFERESVQEMLRNIDCDCFEDIVAASSMNRPGPLSLKMPEIYASNKQDSSNVKNSYYWKYTKETYGTIVYQEQLQQICIKIGKMSWADTDKVMKILKGSAPNEEVIRKTEKDKEELLSKFVKGAKENGINKNDAKDLFDKILVYSFNKGHGVGYSLISFEEMYYKVYHPLMFWMIKMRNEGDEAKLAEHKSNAVKSNCLIFLPHVNGYTYFGLKKIGDDTVIQEGLSSLKGIGEKTAKTIIENGPYIDFPDFEEKISELSKEQKRGITTRTINILKESGALEFREKVILSRNIKYNSTFYQRNPSKR